ncbi:hypothetical protein ABXN37_19715 [Piscinibacter sakaiensis]|uniref:hypothetical protein n=1 Tax=Piscinibacter sakaiensis TaxID=1547922 RepID=UPI0012F97A3A|nr:hypothetical protein [Piscinibacter sakaiensis]
MGQYIDTFRAQPTEELLQRLLMGEDELLAEARADIEQVLSERGEQVPRSRPVAEQGDAPAAKSPVPGVLSLGALLLAAVVSSAVTSMPRWVGLTLTGVILVGWLVHWARRR